MKAVVCRVNHAAVRVDDKIVGEIERGLLAYIGFVHGDGESQLAWMASKLASLRLFPDDDGKMNRSTRDIGGGLLLIPNFTLAGETRKGNRPSFTAAADPAIAGPLFEKFAAQCAELVPVATGVFGAHMIITCACDGPITVLVETPDSPIGPAA
jgi:D-tyrosyl-tRNA(Tyr) deacylase